MQQILAIVVLYQMRGEQSAAFVSLRRALAELAERSVAHVRVEVMVWDNSPEEQAVPASFEGVYRRDTSNPGLAASYNAALDRAESEGFDWMMLLDQDTEVTSEYVAEVLATVRSVGPDVFALVPKLMEQGVVFSPARPPVLGTPCAVALSLHGVSSERWMPFNSGAVVRVQALRSVGGFPVAFPLDYLDHAVFTALHRRGGRLSILKAVLQHELSSNTERTDAASVRRRQAVLDAEQRYYAAYGTWTERMLRRLRLLKAVCGRVVRGKEAGQTWRMLRAALRR